jgi:hypothetical protein
MMGMSNYVLDQEDQFITEVEAKIGGMESVGELTNHLQHAGHFDLIKHMDSFEQIEFVETMWDEFWSKYQ